MSDTTTTPEQRITQLERQVSVLTQALRAVAEFKTFSTNARKLPEPESAKVGLQGPSRVRDILADGGLLEG